MMNSSLGDQEATKNYYGDNNRFGFKEPDMLSPTEAKIFISIILIICPFGLVGNGYIIWLLGFQMKRNCFTTFILNLAIADFGHLTCMVIIFIYALTNLLQSILSDICFFFYHMTYTNSHFLMTAISIDQCVAIFFPIWHHYSRPKYLSPAVCIILWSSSFFLAGLGHVVKLTDILIYHILFNLHFLVTAIICLPLITLSTVILFIKVRLKSNENNQGRLLLMVLFTLLSFLILSFPFSVIAVIRSLYSFVLDKKLQYVSGLGLVLSSLNSSINPVIYFLVGRKKRARSKQSVKLILENVFKEGEATRGR